MDCIFMNSENIKTSKPHVLIFSLTYKIDLRRGNKALIYQILVFTIHGKTKTCHATTMNLKYQPQHGIYIRYSKLF